MQQYLAIMLPDEEIGCMWIAVHIPIQEDHVVEGLRHELCNAAWLNARCLQPFPVCDFDTYRQQACVLSR